MSKNNKKKFIVEKTKKDKEEEVLLREVIESFWEDDPLLDEYYEQLGKQISQQWYIKGGPYWDKIKELNKLKQ